MPSVSVPGVPVPVPRSVPAAAPPAPVLMSVLPLMVVESVIVVSVSLLFSPQDIVNSPRESAINPIFTVFIVSVFG
jgi:hypothetical protein